MAANYRAVAQQDATQAGLNPGIFLRQISQESGFNPNANSGAGAEGIAQIVPKFHPGVNPYDPVASLHWAATYMAGLVKEYGGNYAQALSVYNSGKPDAYTDPNFGGGETYRYVKDILGGSSPNQPVSQTAAPVSNPVAPLPQVQGPPPLLANPAVQQMFSSNDALLGIQAPNFAQMKFTQPTSQPVQGPQAPQLVVHGVQAESTHDLSAVKTIKQYLGTPYKWGGASPGGFDCSGLLQYVWGKQGVTIPRTTYTQWKVGAAVAQNQLRPGDAVFFRGSDSIDGLPGHVGMYIGNGRYVEAPHTGANVQIATLADASGYMGARRYA